MTAHVPQQPTVLFVDDEATAVKYFQRAIEPFAPVVTACTVDEGRRMLDEHADSLLVIVSDQRMPGGYGNELLHYASARYPQMVRILTTAYSELEHTVEAVNQGHIHRYIQKPWEISALRMELKQALEMAALRKDHAALLREKMNVRHLDKLSNRIGTIYTLCATLSESKNACAAENYLSAAALASWSPQRSELPDHAQQIAAEAMRSGEFGHAVMARLAKLRQNGDIDALHAALPDATVSTDGCVQLGCDVTCEFLASNAQLSTRHANWLACLIWLNDSGRSLKFSRQGAHIECCLTDEMPRQSSAAAWIERFCCD